MVSAGTDRVSEIARYIARENPDAAERWVNELFDVVERLTDFPESGRVVPEVGVRRIRELVFGAYRVPRDGRATESELTKLKLVVGPGDDGEPVMTVLLPNED